MQIFGYYFDKNDPTLYLMAWVIVTLFLVVLATKYGFTAVGLAITALFGVVLYTSHPIGAAPGSSVGSGGLR